jgi:hypothetical protein
MSLSFIQDNHMPYLPQSNTLQTQVFSRIISILKTDNWLIDISTSVIFSLLVTYVFNRFSKEHNYFNKLILNFFDKLMTPSTFLIKAKEELLVNDYHWILINYLFDNRQKLKIQFKINKTMINDIRKDIYLIKNEDFWINIKGKWVILSFLSSDDWIQFREVNIQLKSSLLYPQLTNEELESFMSDHKKPDKNTFQILITQSSIDPVLHYFKTEIEKKSIMFVGPNVKFDDFSNVKKLVVKRKAHDILNLDYDNINIMLISGRNQGKNFHLNEGEFYLIGESSELSSHEIFKILKKFVKDVLTKYEQYKKDSYDMTEIYVLVKQKSLPFCIESYEKTTKSKQQIPESFKLGFKINGACSKNFSNIYLKKNQKEFILENEIPHNKGFLLTGPPGTGKTSIIKAISNYLKRNIFMIDLKLIKSNYEFMEIMECFDHGSNVIVFEDIDCMTDAVLERTDKKSDGDDKDTFTLSCFLNYLDGTNEYTNRIVIMTSNHPDKLDSALIRPGRIDVTIELTKCDKFQFSSIINKYLERTFTWEQFESFNENTFSPAEIIVRLLSNITRFKGYNDDELLGELSTLYK